MPALRLSVMGVSGCGKSTVSQALAQHLGLDMLDGDDLHLPESVAKMRSGIALQDIDRWPWLDRIGGHLAGSPEAGAGRVVACSAQRMRQRVGHYMQAGLLDSQFQTLETPGPEETDVITLNITEPVERLVEQALAALQEHRSRLVLHTSV
ncbi:MAG: (d)CMP kinase [Hydrogenophaga sp.]|nr:(d)CMP kinase [Hydrogenophaga sp.]